MPFPYSMIRTQKQIRYSSLLIGCMFLLLANCSEKQADSKSKRYIDDIPFDASMDIDSFQICKGEARVMQYFNNSRGLEYEGGKRMIVEEFDRKYEPSKASKESGLIRIRFIVNCKGETGRFRIIGMNGDYEEKDFPEDISQQLLSISRGLKGWKPKTFGNEIMDYYQYLIFKIEDGHILNILP